MGPVLALIKMLLQSKRDQKILELDQDLDQRKFGDAVEDMSDRQERFDVRMKERREWSLSFG